MARAAFAVFLMDLCVGCAAHDAQLGRAHSTPPPSEWRDVAELGAEPTETPPEEAVDDEVARREARVKLAQARASGCGVGLR